MKKILSILVILLLTSCNYFSFDKLIKEENEYYDLLYSPEPIKSNSIFIGYTVEPFSEITAKYNKVYPYNGIQLSAQDPLFKNLSYDILKEFSIDNKLSLKANYLELNDNELFEKDKLKDNKIAIKHKSEESYPREITIPSTFDNFEVSEIASLGFSNLDNLVIVNLPDTIKYINKYAFAYTNLAAINYSGSYDITAFTNTLINNSSFSKITLNYISDQIVKHYQVNDLVFEITIDLNGGKVIKEELDLCLMMPILENEIFESFENEEGKKIFLEGDYYYISLKDYLVNFVGLTYKINSKPLKEDIYEFTYLADSDSYSLSLLNYDLRITKLKLPDYYLNKPIIEIKDIYNQYLTDIEFGKFVEKVTGKFDTPNLRNVKFSDVLEDIGNYAFCGTILTNINLPKTVTKLNKGVFAYTFIKHFNISNNLISINGSSFARCNEIKFTSSNPNFIIEGKKVLSADKTSLLMYSYNNQDGIIDLKGIKNLYPYVFSYFSIDEIINYEDLLLIDGYAFFYANINSMPDFNALEHIIINKDAFKNSSIKNISDNKV